MSALLPGYELTWHIKDQMKVSGIDTASELHRRVSALDPDAVNYAQFVRIVSRPPARISLKLIAGIAIALDCAIGDLVTVRPTQMKERP